MCYFNLNIKKMIWFFCLGSQIIFGIEAVKLILGAKIDFYTLISIGIVFGIGFSSFSFFLCSAFLGFNKFHILIHIALLSVFSYTLITTELIKKKFKITKPKSNQIIFLLVSLFFSLLFAPHIYNPSERAFHTAFKSDISDEITLMNSFYQGANSGIVNIFKIRHPYCYKCVARTNWLTALHSAMMKVCGLSTNKALSYPSFLFIFAFSYIIQQLTYEIVRNTMFSVLSIYLVYFLGGPGFIHYADKDIRQYGPLDFVFSWGSITTQWSHPIYHYMFAFRPSQYALCLAASIIYIMRLSIKRGEMFLVGCFLGLLLPTQFPAFIAGCLYCFSYFALNSTLNNKTEKNLLIPMIAFAISFGCIIAIPLFHFIPRESNDYLIRNAQFFDDEINAGASFPFLKTWFKCIGISLIIAPIGFFIMKKENRNMLISSLIVFIIGNYVSFSHYNRMNIHYFYPFLIPNMCISMVFVFNYFYKKVKEEETQGIILGLSFVFSILMSISALYGFIKLYKNTDAYWSKEDEEVAEWIANNTPKKAVFIAAFNEMSVVSLLAGKVLYYHMPRLVWLNNFQLGNKQQEMEALLNNPASNDLIPKVEYCVHSEKNNDHFIIPEGAGKWSIVYHNNSYVIYKRNLEYKKRK